ncbi:MAG: hypothetical protein ACK4WB_05290 [Desulfatiglandales bacterium]
MGEIKSTLDIVMERLKKFEVTEEDKKKLRLKELEDKVIAIFNKYQNKVISQEELVNEINLLGNPSDPELKRFIMIYGVELIGIKGRSVTGLSPLKRLYPNSIEALNDLEKEWESRIMALEKTLESKLLFEFRKRDIGGNSIIPNVYSMAEWKEFIQKGKEELKEKVQRILKEDQFAGSL